MRKAIFLSFVLLLILLFGMMLRDMNRDIADYISSPRIFLSQVVPDPDEAVFFLSPDTGNIFVNTIFSTELRFSTSEAITSIKAYLDFDPSLITVTAIATTGSVFSSVWEKEFDNTLGKVRFQASLPSPGFNGSDGIVISILFLAMAPGTATTTYDADSLVLKSNDEDILNLSRSTGGTLTISSDTTSPSPPTTVSYNPNPDNTGVYTVSWSGASDGTGSGIASYDIRRSADGGTSWGTVAIGITETNWIQSPAVTDGTYIYQVRAKDNAGNIGAFSSNTNTILVDILPPSRSDGQPTGTLVAGTVSVDISLTTDESATCQYATSSGVDYGSMVNIFFVTEGTSHSTAVTGLSDGDAFSYFVRCSDALGNKNTNDFLIEFSVDMVPPPPDTVPPSRSNGEPSGVFAAGVSSTAISLTTDESATCQYSTDSGISYDSMGSTFLTTGGVSHSTPISGLADGTSYSYYVRCSDGLGNKNTSDFLIEFSIAAASGGGGGGGGGGGSPPPSPPPSPSLLKGDCNNDGKVNIFDLSILLSNWKQPSPSCDLNSDGAVNIFDFSIMFSNWTG
ncbi:hypothetical protein IID24_00910 [Patescibacteria group bacterium]|nr:hypothetical protein [Patescibacteria group bacterium]